METETSFKLGIKFFMVCNLSSWGMLVYRDMEFMIVTVP